MLCHFCRSDDVHIIECENESDGCSIFWAECDSCGARGPTSEYKDGAAIHWNAAAPEPPAEAEMVDKAVAWDTLITRSGEAARLREALTDALAFMKDVRDQRGDSGVGILIRNAEAALSRQSQGVNCGQSAR
jgi:hypothetical protein